MGVFLGCFSLPFVVAGVIVTSAAAAAWLSLFPCCAPAARRLERCCAPQRGYQQLLMALFLTTFALGWNMAVYTQLLPLAAGMFSASCTGSNDGTGGAPCEAIADGSRCAVVRLLTLRRKLLVLTRANSGRSGGGRLQLRPRDIQLRRRRRRLRRPRLRHQQPRHGLRRPGR